MRDKIALISIVSYFLYLFMSIHHDINNSLELTAIIGAIVGFYFTNERN